MERGHKHFFRLGITVALFVVAVSFITLFQQPGITGSAIFDPTTPSVSVQTVSEVTRCGASETLQNGVCVPAVAECVQLRPGVIAQRTSVSETFQEYSTFCSSRDTQQVVSCSPKQEVAYTAFECPVGTFCLQGLCEKILTSTS